jgi:hypothetical protein
MVYAETPQTQEATASSPSDGQRERSDRRWLLLAIPRQVWISLAIGCSSLYAPADIKNSGDTCTTWAKASEST